jgi:DNA (cytosine-5)-methyltransferase 1
MPTVGELFAGLGGFGIGFEHQGFRVKWAIEKDRFAASTYRANFPDAMTIETDIQAVTVRGDGLTPVDVLTAGFPCQPFSVAGDKKGMDDPRGGLFLEITRLLREFGSRRPKIVVLENVKGFLSHDRRRTFTRLIHELQRAGYWFSEQNAQVLNTSEYTRIPQNRERVFMVAFSTAAFAYNSFRFPPAEGRTLPIRSLFNVGARAEDRYYFNTDENKYGQMFAKKMQSGDPESVYLLRRNYVRENRSGESFTLTANMGDGGHNVPVIKDTWGVRKLTPNECLRLQGIEPSDFSFPVDLSDAQRYKQIGNAVTVAVVEALARETMKHLNGNESDASNSVEQRR